MILVLLAPKFLQRRELKELSELSAGVPVEDGASDTNVRAGQRDQVGSKAVQLLCAPSAVREESLVG